MYGLIIFVIITILSFILKIIVEILSSFLDTSKNTDINNHNNKIEINYDYGHLFNTKYNYLCMDNILRIYDEGAINKDKYLLEFIYGYFLSIKDVASQSYFMGGDEETAEKIARVSFSNLLKYVNQYYANTDKDNLPLFEIFKFFIPTLSMPIKYDENFRVMTLGMLCKNYLELENKFNIGLIDGYVLSVKEWILYYMPLDEKAQIKIAEFNNIEDTKNYIFSNFERLKAVSNRIAHPIIMQAINDFIKAN